MAELTVIDLGKSEYGAALAVQHRLVDQVISSDTEQAYLVLVEHDPPVITLGRGAEGRNVLASCDELAREGVDIHETTRGGDVTYHGPGQLVAYPILRIDRHGRDIHKYLRDLEETIIRLLARFGLSSQRVAGLTGVWVGGAKIAAIGVAVRRWVSYHGVSLNVSPNMSHFALIVPCGLEDKEVTSMAKLLSRTVQIDEMKQPLIECMVEVFGFEGARHEQA